MSRTKKRVLLTGATGSMGLEATRALVAAGHDVIGTSRSEEGSAALAALGADSVEVDVLNRDSVREASAGCDVIAHFATRIPRGFDAVKIRAWRTNDALRREGTAALVAAAEANGIKRIIFESIALAYPDSGDAWIDESVPLEEVSPVMGTAIEAEAQLEDFGGDAVSLRFGRIYGAGRASDDFIAALRRRQMPIVGKGDNYVSTVHVADVGTAVAAAMGVPAGVYNVVDDEPLTQRALLETAAGCLDAPPPRRIPEMLARMMMGHVARVLTVSQRVSNHRFREATDWVPRYPSAASGWARIARAIGQAS
jgi:nucleoside-diphosphate-sugar epimerase